MNYCEECNLLVQGEVCPECSSEKLREVADEDFCFLVECGHNFGEALKEGFDEEEIECALLPWGDGARTRMGLRLENYKVYVKFKDVDRAYGILKEYVGEPETEKLRKRLLDNGDKWYIVKESTVKKLRKRLRLEKDADVFDAIEEGVRNSDSIVDRGLMGGFRNENSRGISVKIGNETVWFSDEDYEIQF